MVRGTDPSCHMAAVVGCGSGWLLLTGERMSGRALLSGAATRTPALLVHGWISAGQAAALASLQA